MLKTYSEGQYEGFPMTLLTTAFIWPRIMLSVSFYRSNSIHFSYCDQVVITQSDWLWISTFRFGLFCRDFLLSTFQNPFIEVMGFQKMWMENFSTKFVIKIFLSRMTIVLDKGLYFCCNNFKPIRTMISRRFIYCKCYCKGPFK